jgi:predicted N-formylglutamate amidohydrolase
MRVNETGDARILLICEHAGNFIPEHLHRLGLEEPALTRHIAWDIGAEGAARSLSALLNAPLILQRWSRLIYDCNRPPSAPDAIPQRAELTDIPGNHELTEEERSWRIANIYEPFHQTIAEHLSRAQQIGREPVVITIHSFTPEFKGQRREVEIGLLFNEDRRLAEQMLEHGAGLPVQHVRFNEPYGPKDGVLHTIIRHAESRGLLNVMIEIRNDFLATPEAQQKWAALLADVIRKSLSASPTQSL